MSAAGTFRSRAGVARAMNPATMGIGAHSTPARV
jgi:hypothetical protein